MQAEWRCQGTGAAHLPASLAAPPGCAPCWPRRRTAAPQLAPAAQQEWGRWRRRWRRLRRRRTRQHDEGFEVDCPALPQAPLHQAGHLNCILPRPPCSRNAAGGRAGGRACQPLGGGASRIHAWSHTLAVMPASWLTAAAKQARARAPACAPCSSAGRWPSPPPSPRTWLECWRGHRGELDVEAQTALVVAISKGGLQRCRHHRHHPGAPQQHRAAAVVQGKLEARGPQLKGRAPIDALPLLERL